MNHIKEYMTFVLVTLLLLSATTLGTHLFALRIQQAPDKKPKNDNPWSVSEIS